MRRFRAGEGKTEGYSTYLLESVKRGSRKRPCIKDEGYEEQCLCQDCWREFGDQSGYRTLREELLEEALK